MNTYNGTAEKWEYIAAMEGPKRSLQVLGTAQSALLKA